MNSPKEVTIGGALAYAAPSTGSYFFYIPMWSILPGIYAKYFDLFLTSIAAVVLFIRIFDGFVDVRKRSVGILYRAMSGLISFPTISTTNWPRCSASRCAMRTT